ncbi:hypothetical protein [Amycolatopsis saalfeldensis]|uniref:hypothetical protein n=1 Tax=Amycolatopsis saalfeldensis TaxID=394193 RepID=UPI001C430B3E|nr:hypothetical protein [Amycolatopsis saalfeldensis]
MAHGAPAVVVDEHQRVGVAVPVPGEPGDGLHEEPGRGRDGPRVAGLDAPPQVLAQLFQQSAPAPHEVQLGQFRKVARAALDQREQPLVALDVPVQLIDDPAELIGHRPGPPTAR